MIIVLAILAFMVGLLFVPYRFLKITTLIAAILVIAAAIFVVSAIQPAEEPGETMGTIVIVALCGLLVAALGLRWLIVLIKHLL